MNSVEERCRYFTGVQHNECKAGVAYASVRDESQGPYRWPCLRMPAQSACTTMCTKRSLLTVDELRARRKEMDEAIELALAGKCPQCNEPLETRENNHVVVQVCKTHNFVSRGCKRIGSEAPA